MIIVWLKFLHVAAISVWSAGLLTLPVLYRQREGKSGTDLHRLHAFTRFFYVAIVSPAAFLAIGSGTALIILQATYQNWFVAKLLAVAVMTGVHIFSGLLILRLFEPKGQYSLGRFVVVMPLTATAISAVLVLVLGKPQLDWPSSFSSFFAPGALSTMADQVIGGTRL